VFRASAPDICAILNGILSGTSTTYPAGGAVIDARGGLAQPLRLNSPYMHHQKAAAPLVAVFDEWARGTFQCCSMVTDNT
jgi:hypothetical protein